MLQPHEYKRLEEIKFRVASDLDAKSIDVRWLLTLIESLIAENNRLEDAVSKLNKIIDDLITDR
jgi:hypothetical protein